MSDNTSGVGRIGLSVLAVSVGGIVAMVGYTAATGYLTAAGMLFVGGLIAGTPLGAEFRGWFDE